MCDLYSETNVKFIILIITLLFGAAIKTQAADVKNEGEGAIMIFAMACLKAYTSPPEFEKFIDQAKFPEIPRNVAGKLIREEGGKAYAIKFNDYHYVLSAEKDNLCTIFSQNAEPENANTILNRLLSGIRTKMKEQVESSTKDIKDGKMTTTTYKYFGPTGQQLINIMVSNSNSESGAYKYAISITSQNRAKNLL